MPERDNPSKSYDRALVVSERIYRALLVVYPREFRDVYGPQMAQVFRDLCREEVGRAGTAGLVVLWVHMALDLLSRAFVERSSTLAGRGFVLPFALSPRLVRWGGVLGVVGGILGLAHGLLFILHFAYPSASSVLLRPIALNLLGPFSGLLVILGVLGLYALVARHSSRIAFMGVLLACLSVVLVGLSVFQLLATWIHFGDKLGPSGETSNLVFLDSVDLVGLVGFLLLGVVAYRARALGRWSVLPLALGFLVPLISRLRPLLSLVLSDSASIKVVGIGSAVLLQLPEVLLHLGWVLLGYLLWSHRMVPREPRRASGATRRHRVRDETSHRSEW